MVSSTLKSARERAQFRVGAVLNGKWRLDSLLGVGGTAAVYAATHRNGKRAAIKILHGQLALEEEIVTRFMREGYAANTIGHPGAVSVLDDDRSEDGTVFLVMELLEGASLERFAREKGERLPARQILGIADELLDVLAAAHEKGVVHRDIKPANLFLTHEGRLKVLDFGIARLTQNRPADATATQTGAALGTPAFMPPEQARGRSSEVDARTDVWAVGATLFALLSGRRPRRAETFNEELLVAMTQPVPPLATVAPQLPPELCAIVDRACAFEKENRFSDARAMQLALRNLAGRFDAALDATARQASRSADASEPIDSALTTSRPIVRPDAASLAPAERGSPLRGMIIAFAATFVLGVAGLGVFALVRARQVERPAAAQSTAAPVHSANAAPTAPATQAPATSAAPILSAVAAPASASALPPQKSTSEPPIRHHAAASHESATAAPTPQPSAKSDLFDQRF